MLYKVLDGEVVGFLHAVLQAYSVCLSVQVSKALNFAFVTVERIMDLEKLLGAMETSAQL